MTLNYTVENLEDSTRYQLPNDMGAIYASKSVGDFTVSHPKYQEIDCDTFEEAEGRLIEILKQELRAATEQLAHFSKKTKEICEALVP